jgi:hypothetical protein
LVQGSPEVSQLFRSEGAEAIAGRNDGHSTRSALIGSTDSARCAGMAAAIPPASRQIRTTEPKVTGSIGVIPSARKNASGCAAATASTVPIASPVHIVPSEVPSTARSTCQVDAPSPHVSPVIQMSGSAREVMLRRVHKFSRIVNERSFCRSSPELYPVENGFSTLQTHRKVRLSDGSGSTGGSCRSGGLATAR